MNHESGGRQNARPYHWRKAWCKVVLIGYKEQKWEKDHEIWIWNTQLTSYIIDKTMTQVICYTPIHVSPWPKLILKSSTAYPALPQTLVSIFGTPHLDPAQPSPFHALIQLPWPRLRNPISGLLFPSPCLWPCVVPHRYKSEPPMYCKTQFEY